MAGNWLYSKPYTALNNGIQIEKFLFNKAIREIYRESLSLNSKFVIGHICRFSYQKNHEFLFDILKEIKSINSNARLMLIGDGNLRLDIENKINELELNNEVLLLGKRSNVAELMQAMDVFIIPSRFEGIPVALIEAQASGLHCVTSKAVTKEAQITGKVEYISLCKTPEYWAKQVMKYNEGYTRDDVSVVFFNSEYNIKSEARKLQDFYQNSIKVLPAIAGREI